MTGLLARNSVFISNIAPAIVYLFPFLRKHRMLRRNTFAWVEPSGKDLRIIPGLIEKGLIKPVLGKTFPLDEIQEAQEYCEAGKQIGKVVVLVEKSERISEEIGLSDWLTSENHRKPGAPRFFFVSNRFIRE